MATFSHSAARAAVHWSCLPAIKSDHKPQAINMRGTNPRMQINFKYNTKNIIIYLQFIVAANL